MTDRGCLLCTSRTLPTLRACRGAVRLRRNQGPVVKVLAGDGRGAGQVRHGEGLPLVVQQAVLLLRQGGGRRAGKWGDRGRGGQVVERKVGRRLQRQGAYSGRLSCSLPHPLSSDVLQSLLPLVLIHSLHRPFLTTTLVWPPPPPLATVVCTKRDTKMQWNALKSGLRSALPDPGQQAVLWSWPVPMETPGGRQSLEVCRLWQENCQSPGLSGHRTVCPAEPRT